MAVLQAAGRRTGGHPAQAGRHLAWPALLTLLALVVPPFLVSAFALAGWVFGDVVNLWLLFVTGVAIALWAHLVSSIRAGRAGLTPEDAADLRFAASHGQIAAYDATLGLDRAAARIDRLEPLDARIALAQLAEFVDQVAASVGAAAPEHVLVEREGWSVACSADGNMVGIGAAYLMVASLPELAAELGRELRLVSDHGTRRRLRAARMLVTAAQLPVPEWVGRGAGVWGPARKASVTLEREAASLAESTRQAAADGFSTGARPGTVELAEVRAAVTPQLWREHLAAGQRRWSASGQAVAPHASWREAWSSIPQGRIVSPERWDVVDQLTFLGWKGSTAGSFTVPPIASPSALEVMAGAALPDLLRRLDDDTASIYFNDHINERYGAAGDFTDDVADQGASGQAVVALDPTDGSTHPLLTSVAVQIEELEHGLVRRDASALARAQTLSASDTPTVVALAAGVRWVSGDPGGVAPIHDALARAPRAAAVLGGLMAPLRNAGEVATADLVDAMISRVREAAEAPVYLERRFLSRTPVVPTAANGMAGAVARELLAGMKSAKRAWLVDLDTGHGPLKPTALFVEFKTLELRTTADSREELIRGACAALQTVWPLTRGFAFHEIAPALRRELRNTPPLWQA